MGPETVITRRLFLRAAAAALATPFLTGCDVDITQIIPPKSSTTRENPIQMGDVVIIDNKAYLLRNNRSLPIIDLEKYKRFSKLEQYGRRVLAGSSNLFDRYPVIQIPTSKESVIDIEGLLQSRKLYGGEVNIFFAGFLTEEVNPFRLQINPEEDTFIAIRQALEPKNWDLPSNLFFSYGKPGLDEYEVKDTLRDPKENIKFALDFFEEAKKLFPYAQFNLIGHSLGGIFALEVARANMDAVNNLIVVNSPLRGIEKVWWRQWAVNQAKPIIRKLVGEEQVSDYLFSIWSNKDYQNNLKAFTRKFVSLGRSFTAVISADDLVVPQQSSKGLGAKEVVINVGRGGLFEHLENARAHSRPLKNVDTVKIIVESLGTNIAG